MTTSIPTQVFEAGRLAGSLASVGPSGEVDARPYDDSGGLHSPCPHPSSQRLNVDTFRGVASSSPSPLFLSLVFKCM